MSFYLETSGYLQSSVSDSYRQNAVDIALGVSPEPIEDWTLPSWSAEDVLGGIGATSRYYMNRFKDAYRQATIDHMLGNPLPVDLLQLEKSGGAAPLEEEDASAIAQHVKSVIDDAKTWLVPDAHTVLGAWGLIDADPQTGDPDQVDMDTIVVLTRDSYYVAQYDEASDRITEYQRVSLIDLDTIELGAYSFPSVFKQSRVHYCLRLWYQEDKQPGYFHTLRSMNIRFFNNIAVTIRTEEERVESVKAIGNTFQVAVELIGCEVKLVMQPRLEKRKSRGRSSHSLNPLRLLSSPIVTLSKPSQSAFKSAGSKAFNNMTSGLARLNPINSLRKPRQPVAPATFYQQKPVVSVDYLVEDDSVGYGMPEAHLPSCGILASSVTSQVHESIATMRAASPAQPSSPLSRSLSESFIHFRAHSLYLTPPLSPLAPHANRSLTPEIFVSACQEPEKSAASLPSQVPFYQLTPLTSQRMRKLSHSSDEVDSREGSSTASTNPDTSAIIRASSASDLQLHLQGSRSAGALSQPVPHSNPVSPLAAFQKNGVFGAPFTALAKGVQSLAPGAGKLARGMQNIGANVDPMKLKLQRQEQFQQDPMWQAKKAACKSVIMEF
ncbi:Inositol phosphatase [Trinorchestia longiramus]|nr:Inositol phosphatase [Trinorchestia longiramus]